jgi:putative CocE/NonD family hydrolase
MIRRFWLAFALAALAYSAPQLVKKSPSLAGGEDVLGVSIRMRDGVMLAADVFLPSPTGRFPTVLVRTPYNRKAPTTRGFRGFVRHGYAVVIEDVRGRYASQGSFGPVTQEGPDGNDTINWIAEQPWSNGRVAMTGNSFLGITQWWAAVQDNPHLLAISPMTAGDDEYLDRFYSPGGGLTLGHRLLWLAENMTPPSHVVPPITSYVDHLPLRTADLAATGVIVPFWRQALDHPSYDAFWKAMSIREQTKQITAAVLSLGGWFDNYAESDLDAFSRLSAEHKQIETWIGPWGHNSGLKFPTINFGHEAELPIRSKQIDWFDRWLKKPSGMELREGPNALLHIFVMGPDIWREEREWPLARTKYTPLYLVSEGNANTAQGDGSLRWQPVMESISDVFTYDPKDPVPTIGGAICCEPAIFPPGPLDQRPVEQRPDVLVYTTPPLTEEVEVTGPVRTILYISTSVNDTDFTAKLVDVQPDGRPLLVTDGIQRLRYRLSLDKPVMVKRNTAYQISIDTGVTSYVFAPGHRIRLDVSSSNFPRFDRSLNSAAPNADQFRFVKARQTIYHEKGYPSAVILPVIPNEAPRGHLHAAR